MVVTWCGGSEVVLAGAGGGDGNDDVGMVEVARWQSHWRGLRLELCTACGEYQCVVCWTAEMRRRGWNRDGDAAAKAKAYDQFIHNYNMHNMGKTIAELHAMLKLHEKGIPKKAETLAGLRESRKLKHGALSLYMGNGMRAAVEAIGSFDLILPSGLIIVLDNCHFAPSVTRGVVLISPLVNNDYIHTFTNYGISVSKDNVFYFNAIPRDGIYEIDMHNLYPNVSSMFNVSNKRAKHALDSSYLWHCRLGHINKKRIDKLQRDGVL
ncbi:zinc finger, CCHC-type containing protein [Tanacetum coccineum]